MSSRQGAKNASWRENSLSPASHAPEQFVLVAPAQAQHLARAQLHFVVALEQRGECLDRWDIDGRRLVDARELLIAVFLTVTTPITLLLLARAALFRDRTEASESEEKAVPMAGDQPSGSGGVKSDAPGGRRH